LRFRRPATMPKLVNRPPSYRRHKNSGLAFVALNGRRIYLGKHGTPESRRAYDRTMAEWFTNGRRIAAPLAPAPLTVGEMIARFWEHAEGYYRKNGAPTSELDCIRQALRPLAELYADTPAADFGPLGLKSVRERMIGAGWSRGYLNRHVGRVKRAFKWAVAEGVIPAAVLHGLAAVPGLKRGRCEARESEPVKPVPEAHVNAVLPFLSRQLAAVVRLQLLTGGRSGEVLGMRVADLNMTGAVWEFRPASHKTEHHGRERVLFLGPKAQQIVRGFLKPDLGAPLFDAGEAERERHAERREERKTKLWPSHVRAQAGKRRKAKGDHFASRCYAPEAYARAVARACVLAGVPHWHPHQLRHNAATLLRRELGIEAARVVLGHSSAAVTEIYAEVDLAKAKAAMERLG